MANKDINLATLTRLCSDEDAARSFLESRLWPDGPACPHCGEMEPYKLTAKPGSKKPGRPGLYKCRGCRKQFTVRVGTIFEDSHIPLSKWLLALHLMTSSKKGVSSLQLSREIGVTVKSAWFLSHRIREAMRHTGNGKLGGTVEADECYVGGKPRPGGPKSKRGRGTKKTPVAVLVERDGMVRAKPVEHVSKTELGRNIRVNVHPTAKIVTDEFGVYTKVGREFAGGHSVVKHSAHEYVNIDGEHTNTAESFIALIKRGHYGIFHQMSKRHLHRYTDEFEFRWNHRKVSDGERMVAAIQGAEGKRLMYRQPCA
jgi:transposase-like protein